MGEYLHNFKGIMKAAGLYHEIRWNVEFGTGIGHIDADGRGRRGVKAEFREPAGRLRPPAAGVDHEVRHQGVHLAPLL